MPAERRERRVRAGPIEGPRIWLSRESDLRRRTARAALEAHHQCTTSLSIRIRSSFIVLMDRKRGRPDILAGLLKNVHLDEELGLDLAADRRVGLLADFLQDLKQVREILEEEMEHGRFGSKHTSRFFLDIRIKFAVHVTKGTEAVRVRYAEGGVPPFEDGSSDAVDDVVELAAQASAGEQASQAARTAEIGVVDKVSPFPALS